jgi:hypothetical protein
MLRQSPPGADAVLRPSPFERRALAGKLGEGRATTVTRHSPRSLPNRCNAPIKAGERAFYYPRERKLYSGECAEQAARYFECAAADEETWGSL